MFRFQLHDVPFLQHPIGETSIIASGHLAPKTIWESMHRWHLHDARLLEQAIEHVQRLVPRAAHGRSMHGFQLADVPLLQSIHSVRSSRRCQRTFGSHSLGWKGMLSC